MSKSDLPQTTRTSLRPPKTAEPTDTSMNERLEKPPARICANPSEYLSFCVRKLVEISITDSAAPPKKTVSREKRKKRYNLIFSLPFILSNPLDLRHQTFHTELHSSPDVVLRILCYSAVPPLLWKSLRRCLYLRCVRWLSRTGLTAKPPCFRPDSSPLSCPVGSA
ncbi:hypothetical protein TNCV_5140081 [Trichonephila clavipes]|nr:hypothetical protein TNCV_5140081 [Trichonephila clavipes]